MYNVQKIHLDQTSSKDLEKLKDFTPIKYQKLLTKPTPNLFAFAIFDNHETIAFSLSEFIPRTYIADILFVKTTESHSKNELAQTLLQAIEADLKRAGCTLISLTYPQFDPLEPTLIQNGWKGPRIFQEKYLFDGFTFSPPWLNRSYKLAAGVKIIEWKMVTENQKKVLNHFLKQQRFPDYISPFKEEFSIEMLNSLALEKEKEIVGWMITHRIKDDTIRYTSLYVENAVNHKQTWIKLLSDSIKLQKNSPIQWANFEVNTHISNSSWNSFVKKHLAPYSDKIHYEFQMWKTI